MDTKRTVPKRIAILLACTVISLIAVLFSSYARYIFAKDYYFIIEAPCDNESQTCFVRDCEDYCPPNSLEEYRTYIMKAENFSKCYDNTCQNICTSGSTQLCEEIACSSESGDTCSG